MKFVNISECVEVVVGDIKRGIPVQILIRWRVARMDIFLLLFSLAAGSIIIGALELIRRFTLAQPLGNRTVSF